jgi:phosphoribosyl 1,2-cyclic phosphodiesterase
VMLWRVGTDHPAPGPLQVRLWGVRGSICASGPRFAEFGGHTPCVEVRCGGRLFIVDAGTGFAALGSALGASAPAEIDLLLSHLHLDHIGGLPFFKPALTPGTRLRIHCGNLGGATAEEALERVFSPPLFPVRLAQLPGTIEHVGFRAGETLHFVDGASVDTIAMQHPDGCTGYRFDHAGRRICYISDIEHCEPWPPAELVSFVRGADLVIYDGMFSETEYTRCRGWGHSTWQKGVVLAEAADVQALAIFHLHPSHDDALLLKTEADLQAAFPRGFIAREGQTFSYAPLAVPAEA